MRAAAKFTHEFALVVELIRPGLLAGWAIFQGVIVYIATEHFRCDR